ncbi:MAG: protein-disulfide reductase DsbD N-terminal domain-containing protein [Chitinophagaceae bacterium]|nr:protein-disulfide reductase DsbD N-terminal domain-containing protein [Chitinophagaceae bacterium]
MKKLSMIALFIGVAFLAQAQLNPVSWTFTAKKIDDKTYELHMNATMQDGWHLYSQTQPEDAIIIPTGFKITNNPLVQLEGKVKEVGKMEKFHDKKLDVSANQYSEKVQFVQVIKLRGTAKTNVTGSVTYQTCNDERCLPPKTVKFSIDL